MSTLSNAFSISDIIGSDLLEQYLGDGVADVADKILIATPASQQSGTYTATIALEVDTAPSLIPFIGDLVQLDVSGLAATSQTDPDVSAITLADIGISTEPIAVTVSMHGGIALWISPDILTPPDGTDAVRIPMPAPPVLIFSASGVQVGPISLTLPACGIGSTGVRLTGGTIILVPWGTGGSAALQNLGVDDDFRGAVLQNVGITLPPELQGLDVSKLVFKKASVGNTGISALLSVDFNTTDPLIQFLGATMTPRNLTIQVEHNSLTGVSLTGTMTLPFFNQPVDVKVGLLDGVWSLSLVGDIATIKAPVFTLTLTGFGVERRDDDTWFKLSGKLQPVVAGYDLPELELKDVLIDQHGQIKASGGQMALTSQKTFKFGEVLQAKITHFAFGGDGKNGKFVSLSGEVDLIQGIPLKGAFDDLRVSWSDTQGPTLTCKGVEIAITVPGVFDFDGKLVFVNDTTSSGLQERGFKGAVHLGITAPSIQFDGAFAVLEVKDGSSTFTALGIEVDLSLPVGIPLLQTNLGIYGFNGLLAWHYGPDLTPYNNDWANWFFGRKPGQPDDVGVTGQHFITKWGPDPNDKGLGAGITIGTMADTSFTWHAKVTFVVLIPGPVLILLGDCNFVSKAPNLSDSAVKGAFQLMIAWDGNQETLTSAISAQLGKDPVIYAAGSSWAFFDFVQPDAWYFDIGTPELPLQATIFKIINATAYLDLSPPQLALGAQAGYSGSWNIGPGHVSVSAHTGFTAVVTRRPMRLTGDCFLDGQVDISVWIFAVKVGLHVDLSADLLVTSALPPNIAWHVHFVIDAQLHVNVIFKTIDFKAQITVDAVSPQNPALPDAPVEPLKAISLEHAHSSETWPLPILRAQGPTVLGENTVPDPPAPVQGVPPDSLPTLVFSVPVYDKNSIGQNPPGPQPCTIGNTSYSFTLLGVVIRDSSGTVIYDSDPSSPTRLQGKWCEELGPDGKTRLQLWADTPYFLSMRTQPANRLADQRAALGPSPCAEIAATLQGSCVSACAAPSVQLDDGSVVILPGADLGILTLALGGIRSNGAIYTLPDKRGGTPIKTACWIEIDAGDSLTFPAPAAAVQIVAIGVTLPSTPPVLLDPTSLTAASLCQGYDASGNAVPVSITASPAGHGIRFTISATGASLTRVTLAQTVAATGFCVSTLEQVTEFQAGQQAAAALQQALAAGAAPTTPRNIFVPGTTYTITVTTQVDGGNISSQFLDTATFTAGGPPGVLQLANPPSQPNLQAYPYGGSLADLDRYVVASVPVDEMTRARTNLFDNPYRGYDIAVTFNEGYLLDLYSKSGNALSLNVVELNGGALVTDDPGSGGAPVLTDVHGQAFLNRLPSGTKPQNHVDPRTANKVGGRMDRFRQIWKSRLASQCGIAQQYPPDDQLGIQMDLRSALAPRRLYELQVTAGDATLVVRRRFSSSRFLTVTHQLQSNPGLGFVQSASAANAQTLAAIVALQPPDPASPSAVSEAEAALFDSLINQMALPAVVVPRDQLDINVLVSAAGTISGMLFNSPEPIPWDRVAIGACTLAVNPSTVTPVVPCLCAISDGAANHNVQDFIELVLLADSDPSGWVITVDDSNRSAEAIYTFSAEGTWPSGTVFRIQCSGAQPAAGVAADLQVRAAALGQIASGGAISLRQGKRLLHRRAALADTAFQALPVRLVRNRDGRRWMLFQVQSSTETAPTAIASGVLRLPMIIFRDLGANDPGGTRLWSRVGDSAAETTRLTIAFP